MASKKTTKKPLKKTSAAPFRRVVWIVMDGVGVGAMPDANEFGDIGSDTLGNLSRKLSLKLPHLQKLGLGNLTTIVGVPPLTLSGPPASGHAYFARAHELSRGKDTTSGHWEMAGIVTKKPMATFPNGFPAKALNQWINENKLPGVLGNVAASGTEIIELHGLEHMETGKPILYTSADSVWQVAAHETAFGLKRLYEICKSARTLCDRLKIARVIARPFVGDPKKGIRFTRTYNRKDYAQIPPVKTYLDFLRDKKIPTLGIGKISNIYAGRGIQKNIDTEGNTDGLRVLEEQLSTFKKGLLFCNLIDFDMLYGHRRDSAGFARAMEEFDRALPRIQACMNPSDLLIITADHGNDPTFPGSDHTREYVPVLCWSPIATPSVNNGGVLGSFADMGATVFEALTSTGRARGTLAGRSFLSKVL